MRVFILSAEAEVLYLGGLYAQQGFEVCVTPRLKLPGSIRVVAPDRWFSFDLIESSNIVADDLVLVGPGAADDPDIKRIRSNCHSIFWINWDPDVLEESSRGDWLYLLNEVVMTDSDVIELYTESYLFYPKLLNDKKQLKTLKKEKISLLPLDNFHSLYYSAMVYNLLYLPAALCRSTVDHFLSDSFGRKIAQDVLQEGLRCLEKQGLAFRSLPIKDSFLILKNLEKKANSFSSAIHLPHRNINPLLSTIINKKQPSVPISTSHLLVMARKYGFDVAVNQKLMQRLERVARLNFFESPESLFNYIN